MTKKTELKPDAPTFVTQKQKFAVPAVQMPHNTRPKSPRGQGWQLGSFSAAENIITPKAAGNDNGRLTHTSNQVNKTAPSIGGTHPSYKQVSTKPSVVSKSGNTPSSFALTQQPFGASNLAAEQPRLPPPESVMVYSAATPAYTSNPAQSYTGNATQSYTTPNRAPARGSDEITNPYDSGERPNKDDTPKVDDASVFSVLTSPYDKDKPHLHGTSPATWEERTHRESFRAMARVNGKLLAEAMPHGKRYIEGMNPPSFKMDLGVSFIAHSISSFTMLTLL